MNSFLTHGRQVLTNVTKHQKVRFGLVGAINTAIDFGVLNILVLVAGLPVLAANIASTTVAMLASFTLNKKAVFGSAGNTRRQLVLFVVVTLAGVWFVQSLILVNVYHFFIAHSDMNDTLLLNVAKVIGICFGLVWNYILYSRVVFRGGTDAKNN